MYLFIHLFIAKTEEEKFESTPLSGWKNETALETKCDTAVTKP